MSSPAAHRLPAIAAPAPFALPSSSVGATLVPLLQRALARQVALLVEPAPPADPVVAIRRIALLVEMFAGVVLGQVLGRVAGAARRAFGSELGPALDERIRGALVAAVPGASADPGPLTGVPFIADAATRPLVDELGARLHVRLIAVGDQLDRALGVLISDLRPAIVAAMTAAIDEVIIVQLFVEHLGVAWQFFTASLAGGPAAPGPAAIGAAAITWRAWLERVSGGRRTVVPVQPAGACIVAIG